MFLFLKNIDTILVKILNDIDNSIKVKNGYTMVAIQSYCEVLLKYINSKEKIVNSTKVSLGDLINNEKIISIIEKDLSCDLLQMIRINNIANDIKHEGKSNFDKKEIEKSYRYIYVLSVKINNYYSDEKVEYNYDSNVFESLLNEYEKEKEEIVKRIQEHQTRKEEIIKSQLLDAISQKDILEKRIIKYETEKNEYLEQLKKLDELEILLNQKDLLLQETRDAKAALEHQINESEDSKKNEYDKKIKELKAETRNLQEQIAELRNKDTIDQIEKIDRDKKILSEKEIEIEQLKALLDKKEIVEEDKLYDLYRKTSLQIGFSSSYINDDSYFIINGVYPKVTSTSKYKSYYAVLNNLLQRGYVVNSSKLLKKYQLDDKSLKEIFRLEMCILSLLRNNRLKDNYWNINYINGNLKLLQIAIEDIFYWIELIMSISNDKFERPKIVLKNEEYLDDFINIKYDNQLELNRNVYNIIDQVVSDGEDIDNYFSIWIDEYIKYNVNLSNKKQLLIILEEIFGFSEFNEGQYEIITHTLNGNNTIGILPTGGGKSLIYQLSSLLEPKITLVIDPINSLIKDQIDGLKKKFGIIRCLNITSDNKDKQKDENIFRKANAMFVFTSPERFQNKIFRQILYKLSDNKSIERIVLDEVHCLSEWGHDFRIPYLMLAETLITYCGTNVKYLGLTATAAANVIRDLIVELKMDEEDVIYLKKLRRNNLTFHINNFDDEFDFKKALSNKIEDINPKLNGDNTKSIIVFSRTKNGRDPSCIRNIIDYLSPLYGDIIDRYDGDHKESQDDFINNKKSLLVATKAFGMGIDKPNIRCTIHFGIPSSFENFYQEAGRAGRDKAHADCYLYTYKIPEVYRSEIERFFDPSTSVNELKEIQYKTAGKIDMSSNFWFLTNNLETPDEETEKTFTILNYLHSNIKENMTILSDNDNWQYEKYLYILNKIGIVLNWEKNYSTYTYSVLMSSYYKDIEHIKNETKKYVSQYKDDSNIFGIIDNINSISQLKLLIYTVRKWYYDKFVQGRRNQLANMYDKVQKFANRNCSEEIQNEIDGYFDLTNIIYKSKEGYSLTFDNDSLTDVIKYIASLENHKIAKRCIEMERILESNTTNNINLYTSLLFLRNNQFDRRNGIKRFEAVYLNCDETEQTEIFDSIAKEFYKTLTENQKEVLLNELIKIDRNMFRNVLLENIQEDSISRKFWIPYINEKLKGVLKYENN